MQLLKDISELVAFKTFGSFWRKKNFYAVGRRGLSLVSDFLPVPKYLKKMKI